MGRDADSKLSDAMGLMRDAYHTYVRELAQSLMEEAREEDRGTGESAREWFQENLHETIDGCGWVIYTAKAQAVCMVSDNDGAYVEDFGPDGIVEDGSICWSRLAYAALMRDVVEQLSAEGFDVDDPSTWKPGDEE